ncbi:MAG: FAD-dependent oxidoreductase [Ignavibacteriales bacterium]|nr:FAD-dependent oxidoreductase [Ignavibacteriales bacterium]
MCPNDIGYKESIRIYNGMISKKPEFVFICNNDKDIIEAIKFARIHSKSISVLGSGHNVSGRAIQGEVVISVRNMQHIKVFPKKSLAICEPGVTMSIFDKNTFMHGLVCTGGTVSSTGISGLTLGGGIGWLHGCLGSTSDNILEFEVLNYLGEKIVCNDRTNLDLFWLLKGAGFGIGVVTKIIFNLHKIKKFIAYNFLIRYDNFDKIVNLYSDLTNNDSFKITFFLSFLTLENNQKVISLEIAFANFEDQNSDEIENFVNNIKKEFTNEIIIEKIFSNYVEFQSYFDNEKKYGMRSYWKSVIKKELINFDWELIKEAIEQKPSRYSSIFIERYHGKMCQIPVEDSAFNKREEGYGILITSTWENQDRDDLNVLWTRKLYNSLVRDNDTNYINYLYDTYPNDLELTRVFGKEKLERIRTLVKLYDPNNLFIKPIVCNSNKKRN